MIDASKNSPVNRPATSCETTCILGCDDVGMLLGAILLLGIGVGAMLGGDVVGEKLGYILEVGACVGHSLGEELGMEDG